MAAGLIPVPPLVMALLAAMSISAPPVAGAVALERAAEVHFEDFVGARSCGACHEKQYEQWRESTHGNAGGAPTRKNVINDFDGTVLQFSDATVSLEIDDAERFLFHVDQTGKARQTFEVAGFVGGGHMMGGGTQTSFARYSDGSWRLLPFDYSRHSNLWFCDSVASGTWEPISPRMSLDDCAFWPPANTFANNCGNCHSSQMQSSFDARSQQEQVRFMNLAINCESCHGPGRRHVELVQGDHWRELVDIGMEPLELLDKQGSVEVCFRCHAMTQKLAAGYLPGKPLHDYYALNFYAAGKRHADGREKGFAYQEGHLYSDCFLSGSMTCVDCHDPHSQNYRDINGFSLPGKLDNGQCTDCHPAKAADLQGHTRHSADSPGSQCVACHMPFLQHKVFGSEVKFERSDHTIAIPRPALDSALDLETACSACHADKPAAWQQKYVDYWYGKTKPHKPVVATVLELEKKMNPELARRAFYQDFAPHPGAQLDLLQLIGFNLDFGSRPLSPEERLRMQELAQTAGPDASALALSWLLQFETGTGSEGQMTTATRRRVAAWLSKHGVKEFNNGQPERAVRLLNKSLALDPGRISDYSALALAYEATGLISEALTSLRSAFGAGLTSRDEQLGLIDDICSVFDRLSSSGMQRSAEIDRLCAAEGRQEATPVPVNDR